MLRFNNQTFRQFVRISVGGARVRVVLTNAFGTQPLVIGGAQVARRGTGSSIVAGSNRAVVLSGTNGVPVSAQAIVATVTAARWLLLHAGAAAERTLPVGLPWLGSHWRLDALAALPAVRRRAVLGLMAEISQPDVEHRGVFEYPRADDRVEPVRRVRQCEWVGQLGVLRSRGVAEHREGVRLDEVAGVQVQGVAEAVPQ